MNYMLATFGVISILSASISCFGGGSAEGEDRVAFMFLWALNCVIGVTLLLNAGLQ